MPRPPPTRSCALVLYPYLAAPLAPIGAGGDHPVGGSETLLTTRLQRDPDNSWLAAPDSAQPGAPAPGVLLPECAAGSN